MSLSLPHTEKPFSFLYYELDDAIVPTTRNVPFSQASARASIRLRDASVNREYIFEKTASRLRQSARVRAVDVAASSPIFTYTLV